jgi:F-type H+-transporting ATPase subunit delta|tara:strand:- start:1770 stop:2306 length:537 start_codon:yes stop_codon:yes gene_type:complete
MSDNYTYARPYAEAVFKTALEDSSLKIWGDSLGIMSEVVRNIEIKAILANPKITNEKKIELLISFLGRKRDKKIIQLLNILLSTKRIFVMKEIHEIYKLLEEDHTNVKMAHVETPFKLTTQQVKSLKEKLEKKYKVKIEIKHKLSKELITGIKVKVDDEVIDFSAKDYLIQLENQLTN